MNVMIVGCGRTGALLALRLRARGDEVTVIDRDNSAFGRLPPDSGISTIVGTGIDVDVQRRAGVESAALVVACTNGDNTNIMAGQIARDVFQKSNVIIRINDPIRDKIFRDLGYQTICPTTLGAQIVASLLVDNAPES